MIENIVERAKELRTAIENAVESVDDTSALQIVELFDTWQIDKHYMVGERVRYRNTLYKALQEHDSQEAWNPEDAPSLFAKVLVSETGEILPWEQPESTNPYMFGDKVTHNGKIWESDYDNNVWEPGVFGWHEVTE